MPKSRDQEKMKECFTAFSLDIGAIPLPECFTFPFYYTPHPLAKLAAEELQEYIIHQKAWNHNFGLDPLQDGSPIGKMFGVLVVQNPSGELGYLSAFSGKLAESNHHPRFVPPVYDILEEDGFFLKEEKEINNINASIKALEDSPDLAQAKEGYEIALYDYHQQKGALQLMMKCAKSVRDQVRKDAESSMNKEEYSSLKEDFKEESLALQYHYKKWVTVEETRLSDIKNHMDSILNKIIDLKNERKRRSSALQNRIFEKYTFLNKDGKVKDLLQIFSNETAKSPAGAGECATPKLLQYAFLHNMKPLAMAEFWWGKSTPQEVRHHKSYYPACKGKCEPILKHMLDGIEIDPNPLLSQFTPADKLEIIYEDEHLLAINKPAEFLSVPGKSIRDSVATRMKARYPEATGPLVVHRLDMSTSGIILIAKRMEVYILLQRQFMERKIHKRYVAVLDGRVESKAGEINLPMRTDIDNRPLQIVDYENGKAASTKWEKISERDGYTRVHLYPITGRTHQLRLHCAHAQGLNTPIVGDDLYGKKGNRLLLHSDQLTFIHPITNVDVTLCANASF